MSEKEKQNAAALALLIFLAWWFQPKEVVTASYGGPVDWPDEYR